MSAASGDGVREYVIAYGHLCEGADQCTCGAGAAQLGMHEQGCGLEPV